MSRTFTAEQKARKREIERARRASAKSADLDKARAKSREYSRNRRRANPERVNEIKRAWRAANRERILAQDRARRGVKRPLKHFAALPTISELDGAWMAGVFEMTGGFFINKRGDVPRFTFRSVKVDTLKKMRAIVGRGTLMSERNRANLFGQITGVIAVFLIQGFDICRRFSEAIMPHLTDAGKSRLMGYWNRFKIEESA